MLGSKLTLEVREWNPSESHLSFNLGLQVSPPSFPPFFTPPSITLVREHISLPYQKLERAMMPPTSIADFWAMLQLEKQGRPDPASPRLSYPAGSTKEMLDPRGWLPLHATVWLVGGHVVPVGTLPFFDTTYLYFKNHGPTVSFTVDNQSHQLEPDQSKTVPGNWAAKVILVSVNSESGDAKLHMHIATGFWSPPEDF